MRRSWITVAALVVVWTSPAAAQPRGAAASVMGGPAEAFGKRFNAAASKAGFSIQFGQPICEGTRSLRTCRFSADDGIVAEVVSNGDSRRASDIELISPKSSASGDEAARRRTIQALSTMAIIAWPSRGKIWPQAVEAIIADAAASGVRGSYKLDGVEMSFRVERSDVYRIFVR